MVVVVVVGRGGRERRGERRGDGGRWRFGVLKKGYMRDETSFLLSAVAGRWIFFSSNSHALPQFSLPLCKTNPLPLPPLLPLTLPIAESTITGKCSGKEQTMSATSRILVASATDEPPNL